MDGAVINIICAAIGKCTTDDSEGMGPGGASTYKGILLLTNTGIVCQQKAKE